jgi:hypothetical protein
MHHHAYSTGVEDAQEQGHDRMLTASTKNSRPKVLHQSIAVGQLHRALTEHGLIPHQGQHCQKQALNQPYNHKQRNLRVG